MGNVVHANGASPPFLVRIVAIIALTITLSLILIGNQSNPVELSATHAPLLRKVFLINGDPIVLPSSDQWSRELPLALTPEYRPQLSPLLLSCAAHGLNNASSVSAAVPYRRRKIFLFAVFDADAVDWMEAKIDEAFPVVDYIVILDSIQSDFENREGKSSASFSLEDPRFSPFRSKILFHSKQKKAFGKRKSLPLWTREDKARDEAYNAVKHLIQPGDWVIQTDTDEVLRREALQLLRDCDFGNRTAMVFELSFTYFGLNLEQGKSLHLSAVVFERINEAEMEEIFQRRLRLGILINDAGWRCSWCMPLHVLRRRKAEDMHPLLDRDDADFKNLNEMKKHICDSSAFSTISNNRLGSHSDKKLSCKGCHLRLEGQPDLPAFVIRNALKFWYALPGMLAGINCSV
jgi:hypothetical protein